MLNHYPRRVPWLLTLFVLLMLSSIVQAWAQCPTISVQPSSTAVCSNSAVLSLTATSLPTTNVANNYIITVDWYRVGSGAIVATSTINQTNTGNFNSSNRVATAVSSLTVSTAGSYYAVVSAKTGSTVVCSTPVNSNTVTVTISPTPATPSVTVVDNCDGTSTLSTNAAGTLLWNTGASTSSITVSSAGSYSVTQTVSGCTSLPGTGTAAPKSAPATPTLSNVALNCTTPAGTLDATVAGTNTYLWSTGAQTASINLTSASASGTYSVTVTGPNGCTSTASANVTTDFTAPAAPTAGDVTVTYDGNSHSASAVQPTGTSLVWFTTETGNTVTTAPSATSAGTYTAWAASLGSNGCYSTRTLVTLKIDPKEITGAFTANNKVYDGSVAATVATYSVIGKVGNDNVNITGGTATFADANAGLGKTVTLAGATLTGTAASNYTLTSVNTATANITPRPITITPNAGQFKLYCDADPVFTYTSSESLIEGNNFTGKLGRAPGENVGLYNYNLGTLSAGSNYTLTLGGTNQFEIKPAPTTPMADTWYTGTPFVFTSSPTSLQATFTLTTTIKTAACDIRTARVSFFIRNGSTKTYFSNARNLPVGLVDPSNQTVGTASATVQYSLKSLDTELLEIGVEVSGNFTNDVNNTQGDKTITIAVPTPGGKIDGGADFTSIGNANGYIKGTSTTNFALQFSKNAKKPNPQGKVTLQVFSDFNRFGVKDGGRHIYYLRSNAISVLNIVNNKATFSAKANVTEDLGNGVLETIEGNCEMQISLTDVPNSTGPAKDQLAVAVFRNGGGLWFSSEWNGAQTIEKNIDQGEILLGTVFTGAAREAAAESAETAIKLEVQAYPNPTTDVLNVTVNGSSELKSVKLKLYDLTNRVKGEWPVELSNGAGKATIDIRENAAGLYILSAEGDKGRATQRIMKSGN